eukprot:TRINITY_DN5136_c0_g1_i1.p1 TRINITY_DN5136_c0_g1~~TRINITY_DN5136_c0_g1_i1.p1  ORF type:complete len:152 (+),score=40.95 TRINITY_DN5136_c0_g1_i1:41-457(+)
MQHCEAFAHIKDIFSSKKRPLLKKELLDLLKIDNDSFDRDYIPLLDFHDINDIVLYFPKTIEEYEILFEKRTKLNDIMTQTTELKECGYEKIVAEHIIRLHNYNDAKDGGQKLIGKLAEMEGVCTRDLYPRFGLELED